MQQATVYLAAAAVSALVLLSAFSAPAADDFGRAQALWHRATAAAEEGRAGEAIRELRAAAELYRRAGRFNDVVGCLLQLADLERSRDDASAIVDLQAAIEIARTRGLPDLVAAGQAIFATTLYSLGRYQEAASQAEAALPGLRRTGPKSNVMSLLELLGQIEILLGQPAKAVGHLEEALRLDRELGAEPATHATFLHNLGMAYKESGRLQNALPLLQESLRIIEHGGAKNQIARSLTALGMVYMRLGDSSQALDTFARAEAILQSIDDPLDLWLARLGVAQVRGQQGRYDLALPLYENTIAALRRLHAEKDLAQALNSLADLDRHQGRADDAIALEQEAVTLAHKLGSWATEATALNGIAVAESDLGHFERSLSYSERALALHHQAGDGPGEAAALINTAAIYMQIGQPEEALVRSEQALTLARSIADPAAVAGALNLLAAVVLVERPETALAQAEEALAVATGRPGWRPVELQGNMLKGSALLVLGRRDEAAATLTKSRDLSQELGSRCKESEILLLLGSVHYLSRQLPAARQTLENAVHLARENHCAAPSTYYQLMLGQVYAALHLNEPAIAALSAAAAAFETTLGDIRSSQLLAGVIGTNSSPYPTLARLLADAGRTADAFDVAERARARALLHQLEKGPAGNLHRAAAGDLTSEESELRRRLDRLRREAEAEQEKPSDRQDRGLLTYLGNEIDQGRRGYEALLLRLQVADPEYSSLVHAAPLSLAEVRRLLAADTTLVEYFVLDRETLAWVIDRDSAEMVRLPASAALLEQQVRELCTRIARREPVADLAASLHAALLAPLLRFIHHSNLQIVPFGALHAVPFAALGGAGDQPLVATHTVSYLPSASVLPFLAGKRKAGTGRALVLGDPDGSLPHAAAEARSVARLYGVDPLLGPAATETALRARAAQTGILHIAAHVHFDQARPLWSHVALAADAANDGHLEVHEIFSLDLRQARLVVLSGCESGLVRLDQGDNVIGLSRAFLYAGAPAVLTTLWPIDDEASAVLMLSFHAHLKRGENAAQSLRAAQLAVRQDDRWRSPCYWAAFALTGDTGGDRSAPSP